MTTKVIPKIILHGGAGDWTGKDETTVLAAMRQAASVGWEVLRKGQSALDAVEAATIVLENHPLFDAGVGSYLNDQGEVEMDALITDGSKIDFGAVAAVRNIQNPISLARLIMTHTKHRFFVAEGAEMLAARFGIKPISNLSLVTEAEFADYQRRVKEAGQEHGPGLGTVGAVAIDTHGNTASATSTGGSPHKIKGRVGDVPVYGAGGYSDDRIGGASATGVGENIMRYFLCKHTVDLIASGIPPHEAARSAVDHVAQNIPNPEVGVIALDTRGNVGAAHTTRAMPIAWVDTNGDIQVGMQGPFALIG